MRGALLLYAIVVAGTVGVAGGGANAQPKASPERLKLWDGKAPQGDGTF